MLSSTSGARRLRARYATLKRAGLCPRCGKNKTRHGARCTACKVKRPRASPRDIRRIVKSTKRHRLALERAGLCTQCGDEKPTDDFKTCPGCREANTLKGCTRYAERRAAGMCGQCGKPPVKGKTLCKRCRKRKKLSDTRRR